jgi:hypothetical protein
MPGAIGSKVKSLDHSAVVGIGHLARRDPLEVGSALRLTPARAVDRGGRSPDGVDGIVLDTFSRERETRLKV